MRFADFIEFARRNVEERRRTFTSADADWPITVITDHEGEGPHAFDAPGQIANVPALKHAWAEAMGAAARITHPTKVALITSNWIVQGKPHGGNPLPPGMMPSQHPDRYEAVCITVADAETVNVSMARVRRRKYGPPLLAEWESDSAWNVEGAMIEPWREALR